MTPPTAVPNTFDAAAPAVEINARVLLISNDRVLLANERGRRWFHLPGGPVRAGETVEGALRREVDEQSGIGLDHLAFIGCIEVAGPVAGSPVAGSPVAGPPVAGLDVVFAADQHWGADLGSRLDNLDIVSVSLESLSRLELRPARLHRLITNWIINARPGFYSASGR